MEKRRRLFEVFYERAIWTFILSSLTFISVSARHDGCVDGSFGWRCSFRCHCSHGEVCDKKTGLCPSECPKGFYGIGCLLKSNCLHDKLGVNYTGQVSTAGEKQCLFWNSTEIVSLHKADEFADGHYPENYCRNPMVEKEKKAVKPWCYTNTAEDMEWSYCTIPKCSCPNRRFGESCIKECHCRRVNEKCHKVTGTCQSGCSNGWTGDASCQIACSAGTFGAGCSERCGQCAVEDCDHETGKCMFGCQPGWTGNLCDKPCTSGSFGNNCDNTCGKCRDGVECRIRDGKCQNGCEPGWNGTTCTKKCSSNRWGLRCRELCGYCKGGLACHHRHGRCPKGCDAGWSGEKCHTDCRPGFYGENCSFVCGYCVNHATCDPFTGKCIGGCVNGFGGNLCIKAVSSSSTAATAGGVVAALALFIAIGTGVLCYLRRRDKKQKSEYAVSVQEEPPSDQSRETDNLLNAKKEHTLTIHEPGQTGDSEPIYANVNTKKQSSPILLDELYDYIQKNKESDRAGFRKEYEQLPLGLMALCTAANKAQNRTKNRYGNIVAYDHSRVILQRTKGDTYSDYINANYMDGYNDPKAYIASQGPNKAMLQDFWRLVWQKNIYKIVMLTNVVEAGVKKCEQYWSDEPGVKQYGDIGVEVVTTQEYTDFTVRLFRIAQKSEFREIKQYHFTTWSDHGAPTYPTTLLSFLRKFRNHAVSQKIVGPALTHCSAGIGRTGTFIALNYLLDQAKAEGKVDVLACAQLMRTNRVNMIQTLDQYVFVYDALLEAITSGVTTIPAGEFREIFTRMQVIPPPETEAGEIEETMGHHSLQKQFDVLQLLCQNIERVECATALETVNISKNRFKNLLPANRCRPYLYTPVDGCNDYINAIFLHSYIQRDAFLVTQMPLPETVPDFWRMMYDYHSNTIVMLNKFDIDDKSCALYWPEEHGYTVEHGPLSIELLASREADPNVTIRDFKLVHTLKGQEQAVKQFEFKSWDEDGPGIPPCTALLRLVEMVADWQRQEGRGPITVHCMNGASRCGVFCAVSLIIERLKIDQDVDIFQAVKQIRINRPQFIESINQYEFCYRMAQEYLDNN